MLLGITTLSAAPAMCVSPPLCLCSHLASLFAEDTPLPPVMCFAMGTLGFLTPFDAAQFRSCLVGTGGHT
jgi:hypothetical protein